MRPAGSEAGPRVDATPWRRRLPLRAVSARRSSPRFVLAGDRAGWRPVLGAPGTAATKAPCAAGTRRLAAELAPEAGRFACPGSAERARAGPGAHAQTATERGSPSGLLKRAGQAFA
jgi:hypothetical protein